jgi:hypothetical protein
MLAARLIGAAEMFPLVFGAVAVVAIVRVDRKDIPKIVRWLFPWNRQ